MIDIKDVHKKFGQKVVLDGVTTQIQDGKTTVFIGPSGCGKSTILKIILRLIEPDSGSINVDDQDILKYSQKKIDDFRSTAGMVFQSAALFDSLSMWENVGFALLEREHKKRDEVKKIASEKLRIVGLEGSEDLFPSELSGGMQKRAAIARAIAQDPKLIFYDEPTTGLDPITSTVIEELMKKLQVDMGITSVIVTHQHSTIFNNADIITMFHKGKVYATGVPDEFINAKDELVRNFIEGRVS
ncbi:MAG: ATP-binding cassette domain-containing protein [Candidatus Sericytochromatia bacterium]|nr:ATP-binding cassette domain-containing protein [Candidatus Sericytochromatia bacterium]